jgi:hypothetical protein
LFAEKYDTIELRRLCIHYFINRLMLKGGWELMIEHAPVLKLVFENLAESTSLYRLLSDNEVYNIVLATESEVLAWLNLVPKSIAARKFLYEKAPGSDEFKILDSCNYHEHQHEAERNSRSLKKRAEW